MNTLQEIIPQIVIPHVPQLRPARSTPSTAGYAPATAPPEHHVPYWIIHSPSLANSMMEDLRQYLTTAPGRDMPPSPDLQLGINRLPARLLDTPARQLSTEETTSLLWSSYFLPIVRDAVTEVDQNPMGPTLEVERTLYSQTPDALISPTDGTSPRLHQENKSWAVFDAYAPQILALAQRTADGMLGTPLELRVNEQGARSIMMKVSYHYLITKPDQLILDGRLYDQPTKSNTLWYSIWWP